MIASLYERSKGHLSGAVCGGVGAHVYGCVGICVCVYVCGCM